PISLPRKTVRDDMGASKPSKYWSVQAIPSNTFVTTALTEHEEQHRPAETANALDEQPEEHDWRLHTPPPLT
ncbi:MAG TPA: hypothetical protein VK788_23870, partial [Terriglobales bacterium]|nr:hypothetical protein [Terriglobales bacterium]